MIKKVKVSDLRPKVYIHDLNCAWMEHPFLRNRFMLESDRDIEKLISYGIRDVYIDTDRGLDVADAPTANDIHQDLENQLQDIGQTFEPLAPKRVSLQEELGQAKTVYRQANAIVRATLEDSRLGKQVEVERLEPVVSAITESIFRNPDALASLIRIKRADKYTFQHSVAVGTLMISFCRSLDADRSVAEQVGMGGLLHDIGKMKIPLDILNKPGKLSKSEFEIMKKHVDYGDLMLKDTTGISSVASCIAAEHHERYDGSGYPLGLKGAEISHYGQMASIVDVYDALTSNRIYRVSSEPTEVLKKLLEWSDHHFNPNLVHRFIRTIGIYPVGTLVKLESGYLAVVIEQHYEDLLHPLVRAVFDIRSLCYITPRDLDLSRPGNGDRIVSFEIPARWRIDPSRHI